MKFVDGAVAYGLLRRLAPMMTPRFIPRSKARCRWLRTMTAIAAVGCSSSPPSHSEAAAASGCVAVTSCGGDVSGTWTVDSECFAIPSPFVESECLGAQGQSTVDVHGTVKFAPADGDPMSGNETVNLAYSFAIDEVYGPACLRVLGLGSASTAACNGLQTYWAGAYAVTCAPVADTCQCQFADQANVNTSDAYRMDGGQIVLATSTLNYCRTGDTLVESSTMGASVSRLSMHRTGP